MNHISQMIKQAEKLEQQGKFAEADQMMQKVSFSFAELARRYGPQAIELVRRYGPQVLDAYNKRQQSEQPQISAPTDEVQGEFVQPQQASPVIQSPLNPQQVQQPSSSYQSIVGEFNSKLNNVIDKLQRNIEIESQKTGDSRDMQRSRIRTRAFQKMISNIEFNKNKAIELAKKYLTYQLQKNAQLNSKKMIFAYSPRELAELGIDRKEVATHRLGSDSYQADLERWQQKFLKPIFDEFFQQINNLAKSHGKDPSKQIQIKTPDVNPQGQARLPGMEGF